MEVEYKPIFIRQFNKLSKDLQEEVLEKVELFKNKANHKTLKVYKLKGDLSDCYSFSVNYKYRIVFEHTNNTVITFLAIGDHDIYK